MEPNGLTNFTYFQYSSIPMTTEAETFLETQKMAPNGRVRPASKSLPAATQKPKSIEKEQKAVVEKWCHISAHGMNKVFHRKGYLTRMFWALVTLASLTAMMLLGNNVWKQYSKGLTTTIISYIPRKPSFPDVKICNRVWFDPEKFLAEPNSTDSLVKVFRNLAREELPTEASEALYRRFMQHYPPYFYATYSLHWAMKYRFDISDYTIQCRLRYGPSRPCAELFEPVHLTEEGICFQLKAEEAHMPNVGRGANMQVQFFFSPEKHFGQFSSQLGAAILVGGPNNEVKDEVVSVSPGESIEIEVSRRKWTAMSSTKETPCEIRETFTSEYMDGSYERPYTMYACESNCINLAMIRLHGCYAFPGVARNESCMDLEHVRENTIRFMNGDGDNMTLLQEVSDGMMACYDTCHEPCLRHVFERRVSVSRLFPNYKYLVKSLEAAVSMNSTVGLQLLRSIKEKATRTEREERAWEVGRSIAEVTIFLKYDHYEEITELVPMHSFTSFLSNIGGSMGLWMGVSVISLIELIECCTSSLFLVIRAKLLPTHR